MENKRELWDKLRCVPQEVTKTFNNGRFAGTDIKPVWRLEKLTETFGPVGFGWYIENVRFWLETAPNGEVKTNCELDLFVRMGDEWSKPIHGVGGNTFYSVSKTGVGFADDEGYKKAYTDAVSVAAKALGVGADIYAGNPALDNAKYYESYSDDATKKPKATTQGAKPATQSATPVAQSATQTTQGVKAGTRPFGEWALTNAGFLKWAADIKKNGGSIEKGLQDNSFTYTPDILARFTDAVADYMVQNGMA